MTSPKLRFKKDDGSEFPDWKFSSLGELVDIERGGSPRPIDKFITTDSDGLNWIKIGDAPIEGNRIVSVKQKIKPEGLPKTRQVSKGDLILSNSMSFGRPYLLEVDGCIHDGWLAIRNSKNVFDITYLLYVLSSETIRKQYKSLAGAGVVTNLNKDLVQQVVVSIPYLKEQQKIAAFFTALDEKISLETQKERTLRTIKDWCCKKLFREEIHLVDTKKWAEKRFEDIAAFINGRAYSQDELLNEGKYLVLRVGNFFTNSKYYYSNLELDPDKYANNGDLLYSWSASFGPRIWEGDKVIFHYHIWKVVPKEIDKKFLFYALQYDVGEIKSQLNGGTMFHLTKKSMEERFLKVPSSAEQKAIGDFLTLLDTRINLSLRKLEVLRTMRRSFMQQMFV